MNPFTTFFFFSWRKHILIHASVLWDLSSRDMQFNGPFCFSIYSIFLWHPSKWSLPSFCVLWDWICWILPVFWLSASSWSFITVFSTFIRNRKAQIFWLATSLTASWWHSSGGLYFFLFQASSSLLSSHCQLSAKINDPLALETP